MYLIPLNWKSLSFDHFPDIIQERGCWIIASHQVHKPDRRIVHQAPQNARATRLPSSGSILPSPFQNIRKAARPSYLISLHLLVMPVALLTYSRCSSKGSVDWQGQLCRASPCELFMLEKCLAIPHPQPSKSANRLITRLCCVIIHISITILRLKQFASFSVRRLMRGGEEGFWPSRYTHG